MLGWIDLADELAGGRAEFLRDYWQQKPLLIRNALQGFASPISPEELAGLACEEGIDSRLVLEHGGSYPWEVRIGPFESADFEHLGPDGWSLLVHEMDRHVADVAAVLEHFRWFPNWRLDDVMISYAPAGASVGAHLDNYDVFLLQAAGRREWRVGGEPLDGEAVVALGDIEIIPEFEPTATWVVEPGDVLYVPPRFAHHGVAKDPSLTFSIGFRAPGKGEMLAEYASYFSALLSDASRYTDPPLSVEAHPGEITPAALERVRCTIRAMAYDDTVIDRWFGAYVTAPTRGEPEPDPEVTLQSLSAHLRMGGVLRRRALAELAFTTADHGSAVLFAAGHAFDLAPEQADMARTVTGTASLDADALSSFIGDDRACEMLLSLVALGVLEME